MSETEKLRELLSALPDLVHDFDGYVPGDHALRLAERAGIKVDEATWDIVCRRAAGNGGAGMAERSWILKTNWGPHIHYFGPQGGVRSRGGGHIGIEPHEFTKDVNRATVFRTRGDAEQFLQWMQANIRHSWLGWKVTEHEWVDSLPTDSASEGSKS